MGIVFMGYQTWGLVSLEALLEAGHEVPLVITHPETLDRSTASFADSVEDLAASLAIPVLRTSRSDGEEMLSQVRAARADLIVSSNWRRVIPSGVLSAARLGGVNVHRSLLPKYGGFSPVNWAVACGETETGVTVHRLDPGLDEGPILGQARVSIAEGDTATAVFHKCNAVIGSLLPQVVSQLLDGTCVPMPQPLDEHTFFHKRTLRDNQIDWSASARTIYDLIRAQSDPFANAYTRHQGERLFIKSAKLGASRFRGNPGRLVARVGTDVVVVCGGAACEPTFALRIERVQREGGEPLPAGEYFTNLDDRLGE